MDTNNSGEELVTKTRKPYTITKQRERWTEDEHNRFLEALRLYGRAWQRIEEHIGTKTAVQIRSHAQKFFTKLEKEAHAKGIRVCQALDIEIPPPRPKRKPSTPYPRKPGNGTPASHVSSSKDAKLAPSSSSSHCKLGLELEKEPLPEKPKGGEKTSMGKENQDDNCSGVSTRLPEAHCSSISSVNKYSSPDKAALRNPCSFREFVPSLRKATTDNGTSKASNVDNSRNSHDIAVQDLPQMNVDRDGDGVNGLSPTDDTHGMQNYPRHVPVHVLNGSMGTCFQNPRGMPFQDFMFRPTGEVNGHSGLFTNPATSATTQNQDNVPRSSHQAFPTFHPAFTPACHTQDDYRSFPQLSSTFSNLIVSTLLQNPAAHAAASFAASFWPYANVGSSNDSSTSTIQTDGAFPPRQMSSAPSMAAIAAATVAAATAWWAAHGLFPVCTPFTCPPMSAAAVPPPDSGHTAMPETHTKEMDTLENPQQPKPEQSKALQAQNLASKSPASSSDDSEEIGRTKLNVSSKTDDHKEDVVAGQEEVQDSNTTKNKKLVDRSSCGSNTPSGSDVETDALEKVEKDKEDVKETDTNQPANESSNRRCRSKDNSSDSWKEVSEEGRLAFQALFARERLPQSFSPPYDIESNENHKENSVGKEKQNLDEKGRDGPVPLDSNCKVQDCSSKDDEDENRTSSTAANNDQGLLTIGLGPGKYLKTRRTGFKPYKRCSVEAKETRVANTGSQAEEKVSKRIRLEGEAST